MRKFNYHIICNGLDDHGYTFATAESAWREIERQRALDPTPTYHDYDVKRWNPDKGELERIG